MQKFTAFKQIEIGKNEIELCIYFTFEKGEAYPAFGELAEPSNIEITATISVELKKGVPFGSPKKAILGEKLESELCDWLLENPDKWR